jgi:hypothetical protein
MPALILRLLYTPLSEPYRSRFLHLLGGQVVFRRHALPPLLLLNPVLLCLLGLLGLVLNLDCLEYSWPLPGAFQLDTNCPGSVLPPVAKPFPDQTE